MKKYSSLPGLGYAADESLQAKDPDRENPEFIVTDVEIGATGKIGMRGYI
jgi:hypothetical protein